MRTLSSGTASEVTQTITRPVYLVEISLPSGALRWSTRETITYDNRSWTAAPVQVDVAGQSLAIFNTDATMGASFLSGASGVAVRIILLYGDAPFDPGEGEVVFAGEIGSIGIGETIAVRLRPAAAKRLPRLYVTPPVFNFLPPDGLRILTASGVYLLERKS